MSGGIGALDMVAAKADQIPDPDVDSVKRRKVDPNDGSASPAPPVLLTTTTTTSTTVDTADCLTKALSLSATVTLHNGVEMPAVGFGTYMLKKGAVVEPVQAALKEGYMLIDSAQIYENEADIGKVLQTVERSKFFVVTKLRRSSNNYERALVAIKKSLRALKVNRIDMYMMHWPGCKSGWPLKKGTTCPPDWTPSMRNDAWRALEDLYMQGKLRAIGVCNFSIRQLKELMANCRIKPMVLQVEYHPRLIQKDLVDFCRQEGIQFQAYASLGSGDSKNGSKKSGSFFELKPVVTAAKAHGKTPAQVLLRWALEKGVCIIPKSSNPQRIHENSQIFDFALTPEEVAAIDKENVFERHCWGGIDPDNEP